MSKYRGKLKGKIIMTPATSQYEVSFEPLAGRYTEEELIEIAMVSRGGGQHPQGYGRLAGTCGNCASKVSEFLRSEGVAMMISNGNAFQYTPFNRLLHMTARASNR